MGEMNLNSADPYVEIDEAVRLWDAAEGCGHRQFCLDQAYVWDRRAVDADNDAEELRCLKRAEAWRAKAKVV